MVPYNKDREPSIWQWTGSSLQASIILNQKGNVSFTNLDEISGRVVLRCSKAVNITSIVVKLEGESRTRLLGSRTPGPSQRDDTKPSLEYHKILYKVLDVFPPANVTDVRNTGKGVFTLPAGNHEYPWKFKIPFNNSCYTPQTTLPGVHFGMSSQGLEVTREPTRHVKKTLPPTLTGFPGEAEISYFIKATIARQGLLKENPRAFTPFNFLPIEPPRPPPTGAQIYARQKHAFAATGTVAASTKGKMKSFFGGSTNTSTDSGGAPSLSIDIRLPEPAIITCNQVLPLSIVVKKLSAAQGIVYLQSLQIALLGYTKVRAHELERIEQHSWVIVSRSNMQSPIGSSMDPEGTEVTIDSSLWQALPLPNTIAPSFETCNISRHYQVDVRLGLSHGGSIMGAKPQTIILPFKLDTLVFSGIAPPAEILTRMAAARDRQSAAQTQAPAPVIVDMSKPNVSGHVLVEEPATQQATQTNTAVANAPSFEDNLYGDAPPSYEDAIAVGLPPVDGSRPAYEPPPAEPDNSLFADEKRR